MSVIVEETTVKVEVTGETTVLLTTETETNILEVGIVGPQGPMGPAGSGIPSYLHIQAVPSATWTIDHNLGYRPGGVFVEDTLGNDIEGDIQHISINQLIISFSASFSGNAYVS